MSDTRRVASGVISIAGLIAILFGLPIALVMFVGWPLPESVRALSSGLTEQMSDEVLNKALACLCWALWAQFLASVVVEAIAWQRHGTAQHIPLGRNTQKLARHLVLAVVLLFASGPKQTPATIQIHTATPAVAIADVPIAPTLSASIAVPTEEVTAPFTYTVKPHDDLWSLAERHLGAGQRWREIFELNKERPQSENRSLQDPGLIRPGWTLQMPHDAVGIDQPTASPVTKQIKDDVPSESAITQSSDDTPQATASEPSAASPVSAAEDYKSIFAAATTLPKLALLGGGISAAGVLALLIQLRRIQQRHRPIGARSLLPTFEVQETERALRISADASEAERLDLALRALSCCLSQHEPFNTPKINAVRVHDAGVEFLFDRAVGQPSGPFELRAGGQAWWLAADVHEVRIGALATDVVAPIPALASIGTVDGATVLIDLEAARTTSINADGTNAHRMASAMALEAATNRWADFLNIFVIGTAHELGKLERVRAYTNLADALVDIDLEVTALESRLSDGNHTTALDARLINGTTEGWVPTVIFITEPQDDQPMAELTKLVGPTGRGAAVVAVDWKEAERTIDIKGDRVEVTPPSIVVDAPAFSDDDSEMLDQLLHDALDTPAYIPAESEAISAIDVRENVDVDDVVSQFDVVVGILGPVQVTGNAQPFRRKRALEVVAYLATHPQGTSGPRLMDAVWADKVPTRNTFNTIVSNARSCLGFASEKHPYLVSSQDGSDYRLLPSVGTDFAVFESLVTRARSTSTPTAIALLTKALSYVRDMPFASSDGYQWAHSEGIVTNITAVVADAACQLAELALEVGDNDKVRWAAAQGLLISPGFEPLYCFKMRAFAAEGNTAGVDAVMTELRHALDLVEPYDSLMPDTLALYESLRGKRRVKA